ncbi:ubiquitin carboxyl-terminal hydrolase CYLD [Morone saxatilis]|uniref:ubiquitin carboxyl-terminal hydrolase CYLD n=1 Tax=Morone saxatilis TaxID=34816 RepID=UPI0015E2208D|nr:ubiquitin carboxyl-terminal hydrolase CYLD [Morone saxatilis]
MSSTEYQYFIITRKPEHPGHINAGSICFIYKYKYTRANSSPKLLVYFLGSQSPLCYDIEVKVLEVLSPEEAGLLQALSDDAERLKWFRERDALRTALGLTEGTAVTVDEGGEKLRGIIRYIGNLTYSLPLSGTFFGIELQGDDRGKGNTDGKYQHRTLFCCSEYSGIFAPFSRVRPLVPSSLSPSIPAPSSQPETEELEPGERVTYFIDDKCLHGMVLNVRVENGQDIVQISTDKDENGKTGGTVEVPLYSVFKGEVPAEPERMDVDTPLLDPNPDDLYRDLLSVNSLVEVTLGKGNTYGIIRWIGKLPDRKDTMAGLELEEDTGVSDGTFKKERIFVCPPKRALFVKLISCRPDSRFQSTSANHSQMMPKEDDAERETEHSTGKPETVPPMSTEQVNNMLIGRMRGIQGHCNSCYMDAALFRSQHLLHTTDHTILMVSDQNHSLVLPTVQQLLEHSFHSEGLKLAEVPSCLILQMPRFGKKFKMFDKIIPSLELDITDLLSEGPQQCMLCGNLAQEECTDCFKDPLFSQTGFKIFCNTCSSQVHAHPQRRNHQRTPLDIPKGYLGRGTPHALTRDKLELFAVLCIETSHYVSFIKHGPNSQDWIFFDSMADRQGEKDGFNIPEVHACPEVGMYMEMSPAELANQVPRDMKGVAKRLFCDAYMYLYQSTNMCLYR